MDPKGWKFEQHKCYVQKEWRERCVMEDLVSLKCLHCQGLLEEQPNTMVCDGLVAIAMERSAGRAMVGEELMGQCVGGVDVGRKGVFCPNLYSPLCTNSRMNRNI